MGAVSIYNMIIKLRMKFCVLEWKCFMCTNKREFLSVCVTSKIYGMYGSENFQEDCQRPILKDLSQGFLNF